MAELAGDRKMARAVGNALHKNPDPDGIPCFPDQTEEFKGF